MSVLDELLDLARRCSFSDVDIRQVPQKAGTTEITRLRGKVAFSEFMPKLGHWIPSQVRLKLMKPSHSF